MRILLLTFLSLLSCPIFSEVQKFKLDNGLTILVKEDHRAPIVVSMVWYGVGSADEPGGITGVSHVLEHLMFKGTKKYPSGVFSKKIAAIGGQENALTNNDYTAYYEKVTATNLPICFELEADRMQNLLLDATEFSKEIKVIQEERRQRVNNNPQSLAFERFLATAHLTAPYNHPVIGWMSDLKQLSAADAKEWYQRYYAPNNAVLVVVGDVKPANVEHLAKKYFGNIRTQAKISRKPQKEPPLLGKKSALVHASAQVPMLLLGFTVPSVKTTTKQTTMEPYVLEVIANLISGGDSGRFSSELVRTQQIASNIDVFYNLYARYQTQFILYGTPSRSHTIDELKTAIFTELKRLQTEPINSEELQRAKTQIIAQKTFERDSIFGQAMELGLLETLGFGVQTAEHYVENISHVTAKEVQEVAKHYFQENNLTETVLIPMKVNQGKEGEVR